MLLRIKRLFSEKTFVDSYALPTTSRHDDIYFASFPKSGNTWLAFILANIIVKHLKNGEKVNFFNYRKIIPDLHFGNQIPENLEYKPFPRILKTHSCALPQYKKAIVLFRDPRDVMVSFYNFVGNKTDLSSFIREKKRGIYAWVKHTESFLAANYRDLHFVRYEDLKVSPFEVVQEIVQKMGINVSDEVIKDAIEESSLANMKQNEALTQSDYYKVHRPDFKFVRKGKVQGYKEELKQEDIDYIMKIAGPSLEKISKIFTKNDQS